MSVLRRRVHACGFVTVGATHLGLLYSATAARQVCAFLSGGRFLPAAAAARRA